MPGWGRAASSVKPFHTTPYPVVSPFRVTPCVLPLLAVLVRLKIHTFHEYVFNFNGRAYHPSGFSVMSP